MNPRIHESQARWSSTAILVLSTLLCSFGATERPGYLVGRVLTEESSQVLPGVQVVALNEAVFAVASTWTDEDGRFELEVTHGEYDLRAVANDLPLQAGFHRDLRVTQGKTLSVEFKLRSLEAGLREAGIDPEWLIDGDGDGLPDLAERETNSDYRIEDTDGDGMTDGFATWVGANAKLGPSRSELSPGLIWPKPESEFPLLSGVPLELLFDPVPGATGYQLRVFGKDEQHSYEKDHDLDADGLLLGEACALRWSPPSRWDPGIYQVRLRGYFGTSPNWIGGESGTSIKLFSIEELEPLTLSGEGELSGMLVASTIHIAHDAQLSVAAGEWLHLVATDGILVEEEGQLVGAEGEKEKPPADIFISSGGAVRIFGTIASGDGAAGENAQTLPSGWDQHSSAQAGAGGKAGDLAISVSGAITVGRFASLTSGAGGRGGEAKAEADPTHDAIAFGGRGGTGGRLLLHGDALIVADRPELIVSGAGNRGGDAHARGGDGETGVQAGLSTALPGAGGDAGDLWLSSFDLRQDGFITLAHPDSPISGGVAGDVGGSNQVRPAAGKAKRQISLRGRSHEVIANEVGGAGWSRGGAGQPAVALGGEGFNAGAGGFAHASSGPGGRVRRLGMSYSDAGLIFAFIPEAGSGGVASATGGEPGRGIGTPHGAGGSARALGGEGGSGHPFPAALLSRGGEGGSASAKGIAGRMGKSGCPTRGQDGSDGGGATSISGAGGFANGLGGNSGSATAHGASGGGGGMGNPGGRGGKGSEGRASLGPVGHGFILDGMEGGLDRVSGKLGSRGPRCPN